MADYLLGSQEFSAITEIPKMVVIFKIFFILRIFYSYFFTPVFNQHLFNGFYIFRHKLHHKLIIRSSRIWILRSSSRIHFISY